jgi:hypothetical protein
MDRNSLDGKSHFHSSPRYTQVLTGNGFNGNPLTAPWDVFRKYGIVPFTSLPFDANIGSEEYLAPISQNLLNLGQLFLAAIGGKSSILYHWIQNGGNVPTITIDKARQQAPVCIGIAVNDGWNQVEPTPPPSGSSPGHSVMDYNNGPIGENILDGYIPYEKILIPNYPIVQALQGIVTINPPPPAPIPPPNPTPAQTQNWLTSLVAWLKNLLN